MTWHFYWLRKISKKYMIQSFADKPIKNDTFLMNIKYCRYMICYTHSIIWCHLLACFCHCHCHHIQYYQWEHFVRVVDMGSLGSNIHPLSTPRCALFSFLFSVAIIVTVIYGYVAFCLCVVIIVFFLSETLFCLRTCSTL